MNGKIDELIQPIITEYQADRWQCCLNKINHSDEEKIPLRL